MIEIYFQILIFGNGNKCPWSSPVFTLDEGVVLICCAICDSEQLVIAETDHILYLYCTFLLVIYIAQDRRQTRQTSDFVDTQTRLEIFFLAALFIFANMMHSSVYRPAAQCQ